jgi:hypothetical protein
MEEAQNATARCRELDSRDNVTDDEITASSHAENDAWHKVRDLLLRAAGLSADSRESAVILIDDHAYAVWDLAYHSMEPPTTQQYAGWTATNRIVRLHNDSIASSQTRPWPSLVGGLFAWAFPCVSPSRAPR